MEQRKERLFLLASGQTRRGLYSYKQQLMEKIRLGKMALETEDNDNNRQTFMECILLYKEVLEYVDLLILRFGEQDDPIGA